VAKFSLRRFENQAQVSALLSLLSVLPLAVLTFFVMQKIDWAELVLYYGPNRRLAILGTAAVTLVMSAIGFGLGLSSAGQRRNDKQQLSWVGFFTGAIVLAMTMVVIFLFMQRGEPIIR
jgi:hypothetical protein